tara:strand:- start:1684 stop:4845 length:3162 start_codon:yes stop_codon:yes gene_type:complete
MVDSVAVFPPNFRVLDSNGDPVSGAKIYFDDAGTTDDQTTYSDSSLSTALPNPIICDSGGRPTSDGNSLANVYVGTTAYKCTITDSDDVQLYLVDDQKGAIDTSSFGTGSGTYTRPVTVKTSDYSVVSGDQGDLIQADPTGATFTLTLPSAVTVGDGFAIGARHDGTANEVRIATISGQTIDIPGSNATSGYALTEYGHQIELTSNGSDWVLYSETKAPGHGHRFLVTDRLTAAPSSPNAGAFYLINGTPTGDWSTLGFSENDIVQADGQGGWHDFEPQAGWQAWIIDENLLSIYYGSAWNDQTGMPAAQESQIKIAIFEDQKADGTDGGGSTGGAGWNTRDLNTFTNSSDDNVIADASLASNAITLPAGVYLVVAEAPFIATDTTRIRFKSTTTSKVIYSANANIPFTGSHGENVSLIGVLTLSGSEAFELQYEVETTRATIGLGAAHFGTGIVEVFSRVTVIDLTALQGAQGSQGAQGATGDDAGIGPWDWETSTSSGPSSGAIRMDNATFASVTEIYIHETDGESGDQSGLLATFDDSTSTVKGIIRLHKNSTPGSYWIGQVTALVDNGSDVTLSVTHLASNGSFSSSDEIFVDYFRTGDAGTGATGANGQVLIDYTFDSASQADSDPGTGVIRANNATAASVTAFYIDDIDRLGDDQSTAIDAFDASTSPGVKSSMYMEDLTTGERWTYHITAVSDSSGYWEITVTHVSGTGSFASNNVAITVIPRGDAGSGLADIVDDTTPESGGVHSMNSFMMQWSKGSDIASASTLTIPTDGNSFDVTGTTTVTALSDVAVGTVILLQFDGALTLTHHATNLILPTGANITTAAGDAGVFWQYAAGDWQLVSWQPAGGYVEATTGSAVQKADGSGGLEAAAATDLGAGKHAVWIPAGAMTSRTTNGAAFTETELATNDIMLASMDFDTTTEEGVGFIVGMPKSWNESTVTFQPYWTAATGSGGVVFGLAAYAHSDSDALDTAVSGQQTSTDTLLTANDMHIGPESSAITIGGTPAEGDAVYFELTREVANGSDTIAADVKLFGIILYITTNAITDA